jgi:hypothetical protein
MYGGCLLIQEEEDQDMKHKNIMLGIVMIVFHKADYDNLISCES